MSRKKDKTLGTWEMGEVQTCLALPDIHAPYHDVKALSLAYQVGQDLKPDLLLQGGDMFDFYALSSHGGMRPDKKLLMEEVHYADITVRELENVFPKVKKVLIEGNHEFRFDRYIVNKAPELFGLTSLNEILNLKKWEIIPYGPEQLYPILNTKLYARHEPYGAGLHCAHLTVTKGVGSFMYHHTHRKNEAQIVSASGKVYRGFCSGWLGDKKSFAFDYIKTHYQWTQGFAIVYALPNGNFFHEIIDIIDNTCIWNGKVYRA